MFTVGHKSRYVVSAAYCCLLFLSLHCSERLFENPADTNVTLPAPTGVTTVTLADTAVQVGWSSVSGAAGYEIQRQVGGGSFTQVGVVEGSSSYTDNVALLVGQTYSYGVRAVAGNNHSGFTESSQLTISFVAPSSVSVLALGDSAVQVAWTYSGTFQTGFEIERQIGTGSFQLRGSVTGSVTQFIDTTALVAGQTYAYRVRALSHNNQSAFTNSNQVSISFVAPTNVTAIALADTAVRVSWIYGGAFQTGFEVERQVGTGGFQQRGAVSASVTQFLDTTTLLVGQSFTYRVRAVSRNNQSAYVATGPLSIALPAPSSLQVTSVGSAVAQIQWQDNSSIETGFEIELGTDGVNFVLVMAAPTNTTNATVPVLYDTTQSFYFRVRARSVYNVSSYSNSVRIFYRSGLYLYAGGTFTSAGGVSASRIARWNGNNWTAVASGVNDDVYALCAYNAELYVGGKFTMAGGIAANRIAMWNGASFSGIGSGTNGNVYSIAVYNNEVYAAGGFTTAGGNGANHIARWGGNAWMPVGSGMNSDVRVADSYNNELYAGGYFTMVGGDSANAIAKWNGNSWSSLGLGAGSIVFALAVYNNALYVGGALLSNGIAKWNGNNWSTVGLGTNGVVTSLQVYNNELYAGGTFTTAGGISASRIARWNGNNWATVGQGVNNSVAALAVYGNLLYVAGGFTTAGGNSANYVARWNGNIWASIGSGTNNPVSTLSVLDGWTWENLP